MSFNNLKPVTGADAYELLDVASELGMARTLPVDPFEIADLLGVEYALNDLGDVSGRISLNGDRKPVIEVNAKHHINRQRFTMGHELGHLCQDVLPAIGSIGQDDSFEDKDISYHRDTMATDPKEVAANLFAAQLLMPSVAVHGVMSEYLKSGKSESEAIGLAAKRFNVSPAAMGRRYKSLTL